MSNFATSFLSNSFSLICSGFIFMGCASKVIVKSDPAEADVFIRSFGTTDKKLVGKTPLTLSSIELQEKTKIDPSSGEFFEMIIEKKEFVTQYLMIPTSRLGHQETIVLAKLKPGQEEGRVAHALLQLLFNAQKFANQKEFERAQIEIEKAFAIDPTFIRGMSLRGSIHFVQRNYQESLKWFEKALQIDPQFEDAIKMITQIKKIMGDNSLSLTEKGTTK